MGQVINLFTNEVIADDPRIAKMSLLEVLENNAFYAMDITTMLPNFDMKGQWAESDWDRWKEQAMTTLKFLRESTAMYHADWKKNPDPRAMWDKIGGCTEFRKENLILVKVCQQKVPDEGNVHTIYSEHTPGSRLLELIEDLEFVSEQAALQDEFNASEQARAVWRDNVSLCFEQVLRLLDMAIEKIEPAVWGEGGSQVMDVFTIVNENHPEAEDLGLIGHNDNAVGMMAFLGLDPEQLRKDLGLSAA
jgi:hypothetical protein